MADVYRLSCSHCKEFFEVNYGGDLKKEVYEIFSCSDCKNLFSILSNDKNRKCPSCGNTDLISYHMNKGKNISYYKKMLNQGLLSQAKYNQLAEYWKNIESKKCPKCGFDTLTWNKFKTIQNPI